MQSLMPSSPSSVSSASAWTIVRGKPSSRAPRWRVGLLRSALHQPDHQVVRDQGARVHDRRHLATERRAGLHGGAQDVAGRDVGDGVGLGEALALGSLACALLTQNHEI